MNRNLYKLTKIFDDFIVMLILCCRQDATAKTCIIFEGFLMKISKTVQLLFTKLMSFLGNQLQYLLKLKG